MKKALSSFIPGRMLCTSSSRLAICNHSVEIASVVSSCVIFVYITSLSDETPNSETLEAMAEVQAMMETDAGEHFDGSTSDFLTMLSEK